MAPVGEHVVVGLYAGELELGVAVFVIRAAGRIGKKHFAVDAVDIQCLETLHRIESRRRHLLPHFRPRRKRITHHRGAIAHIPAWRPTVDAPTVDALAVFLFSRDMRDAVSPLLRRHARGKVVAVERGVRVRADEAEFYFHDANIPRISRRGKSRARLRKSLTTMILIPYSPLLTPHGRPRDAVFFFLLTWARSSCTYRRESDSAAPDGTRKAD